MELQEQLVLRAKNNDAEAFAQLYQSIYKDLYRFAVYTLQNQQDAEDVVSDAVLDAYRNMYQLKDPTAFKSWMFTIVSCKCKKKIKEYKSKWEEIPQNLVGDIRDLSENVGVLQALGTLTEEERLIVTMSVFGGYKGKEIGSILHKKHSTIRSKYRRALEKLRKEMVYEME
ncbi:MAG TPA: RNA polymerase subunit sigma-70 [Lachnospiraceae bacterium]|nr:RNA polymerase sigma factor [uncultured Lachnoclostridium sp.]HAU87678.1 RNA polymerase subunit sigma-70 [Lachnospiraceae bacterium]